MVCSALISGSEVSYFSLSPSQIDKLKHEKCGKALGVLRLLTNPDYLLGTILQANNLVNILIVLISTKLMGTFFDFSQSPVLEFIVNGVIVTFLIVLFGEVLPKIIATSMPVQFAKMMSKPLRIIMPLGLPFNFFMSKFANQITDGISLKPHITLEDLDKAVDISSSESMEEKKILKGIVKLPTTDVCKIMKPRVEVKAVDMEMTISQIMDLTKEVGYSRFPVYKEDLDDIKGFLYIKDILPYMYENSAANKYAWRKHIREAYFVPESKKINDLLQEFREKKIHLAVVVDEYGGTDGIVTLEDILEEIVGEIEDESDVVTETHNN